MGKKAVSSYGLANMVQCLNLANAQESECQAVMLECSCIPEKALPAVRLSCRAD